MGFATHLNVGSYIRIVKDKSLLRCLQMACSTIVQDISDAPDAVSSVLDRAESEIFAVTNMGLTNSTRTAKDEIESAITLIENFQKNKGHLKGIGTGFHKLDEATTGWQPGDMVVLAARRPGPGQDRPGADVRASCAGPAVRRGDRFVEEAGLRRGYFQPGDDESAVDVAAAGGLREREFAAHPAGRPGRACDAEAAHGGGRYEGVAALPGRFVLPDDQPAAG